MSELIKPETLMEMGQEDILALIQSIRERRERVQKAFKSARRRGAEATRQELRDKLERRTERLGRHLEKLDAMLSKADLMVSEIVAIRLQAGDSPGEMFT